MVARSVSACASDGQRMGAMRSDAINMECPHRHMGAGWTSVARKNKVVFAELS